MFSTIQEIDANELARLHQEEPGTFRVLDVRQPQEIAAGSVPNAEPVPMHTVPLRLAELDREHKYVVVCRSGARSAQVCMFMQQQGYENVFNLRGGIMSWATSGQDIVLPKAV